MGAAQASKPGNAVLPAGMAGKDIEEPSSVIDYAKGLTMPNPIAQLKDHTKENCLLERSLRDY